MAEKEDPSQPAPAGPADQAIKDAFQRTDLPNLYANGFALGLGNADVVVVLQRQKVPVAVLNLSYTLAKTLAQKLGGVVAEFERAIGDQNILTTDRIDEAFKRSSQAKSIKEGGDDEVH